MECVDLKEGVIRVRHALTSNKRRILLREPKTKKSRRSVHITSTAVQAPSSTASVSWTSGCARRTCGRTTASSLPRRPGSLINPMNLTKRYFEKLLERAGLPSSTRFYDLQHTRATMLLSRNIYLKVRPGASRHTIAITLDAYSRIIPGMGDHTARAMEDA